MAVRLGALQTICTTRGIRPMTEKEIRDNIEKFELGNNIVNCYPNKRKLVKAEYTFKSFYGGPYVNIWVAIILYAYVKKDCCFRFSKYFWHGGDFYVILKEEVKLKSS